MTACSPPRASGQRLAPAPRGWDARHRGDAVRTAAAAAAAPGRWRLGASPLLSRSSGSAPRGSLTSCGAAGPPEAVLEGPCPRRLAQPRVGLWGGNRAAGEWRQKVQWPRGGRKEAGRRQGKRSDHLLKSERVGRGAPKKPPEASPSESEAELAKGPGKGDPLKPWLAPGRGQSGPSPSPGVPARGSSSLRQARSTRTVAVGPEQAAAASSAGRRAGGSARHHPCWPPSRGRSGAGEAAGTRGWTRGLVGKTQLPRSAAGALHPGAPHPRAPLRCQVRRLQLGSSAVRSLSSLGSPHPVPGADRQRHEGLGLSKARVPCLRAEVLRESPLGPGEGGVRGLEDHTGRTGKAFPRSSRSPECGGGGSSGGSAHPSPG